MKHKLSCLENVYWNTNWRVSKMCTQVRRVHHIANSYTHIGLSHGWKLDSVCSCVFYSLPVNCGCFRSPRASAAASFEAAVFFIHALVIYPHHYLFVISSIVIRMVFCVRMQWALFCKRQHFFVRRASDIGRRYNRAQMLGSVLSVAPVSGYT